MNEKVTQMVSLLFKDLEPTQEVLRLQEEVLNNCQDRFMDLTGSGLSEEESLAAVMESLKGMDEVLKEYPRKENKDDLIPSDAQTEEKGPSLMHFQPEDIRAIDAQLTSCDVEIMATEGGCDLKTVGKVFMELTDDGTLRLWQEKPSENLLKGISWEKSLDSFEHFGDALNQLGQNLADLISRGLNGDEGECRVTLSLPRHLRPNVRIRTTSGDIAWQDLEPGEEFSLMTTSGDVRMTVAPDYPVPRVQVSTTSGDMAMNLHALKATVSTVSGDVTWEGKGESLDVKSTSGDAEIVGHFQKIAVKTTSGDLALELTEAEESDIQVNTISGDMDVRLPASARQIAADLNTVSGDIRCRGVDIVEEAPVRLKAQSVSGDLKLH